MRWTNYDSAVFRIYLVNGMIVFVKNSFENINSLRREVK